MNTPKRVYAKVRRGWYHVYLGFFFAGTVQEDKVALEVDAMLNRYPDAVASVSEQCHGAMAEFPVIGEFPIISLAPPVLVKPTEFSPVQRRMLESMRDGKPFQAKYKEKLTGRALLTKGCAERVDDTEPSEWWLKITAKGLARLAESESEAA